MASDLTLIGVEAPAAPRRGLDGAMQEPGRWRVGGELLLERTLRFVFDTMGAVPPGDITILTGEPDGGVFDAIERFGVRESNAASWLGRMASLSATASPGDIVIIVRAGVVLASGAGGLALHHAVGALRELPQFARVEPAYRPGRQPPNQAVRVLREAAAGREQLTRLERLVLLDGHEAATGMPCPAFEVHRLASFGRMPGSSGGGSGAAAFVWLDEDDFALLETPLDELRAEAIL